MQNGDISNESSPRIIVVVDVVTKSEVEEPNRLLITKKSKRKILSLDNLALSHLWNVSSKYGLSVELAGFESELWTQEHLDSLMERLENRGGNPFNYAQVYANIDDFISELPYRNNLRGVVDLRERVARYGSRGVELLNL